MGTTRGADGVCCEYNNVDMRCVLAPHVWHDCGLVLGRIWSVLGNFPHFWLPPARPRPPAPSAHTCKIHLTKI